MLNKNIYGGHGIFASDWDVFLKFMKMHLEQER